MTLQEEFERQATNLLQKEYPKIIGISPQEFIHTIEPLKEKIKTLSEAQMKIEDGHLPFVIVIKSEFITPQEAMSLIEIKDEKGLVNMDPLIPADFQTIPEITIPTGMAYLLVNVETGRKTLNVRPQDALEIIKKSNRSPLTIDEGISLVTHFPEVLTDKKNFNCFQMLASRRNDKRIPSIWISYNKPRLGWCWNGNPHTWLGSASCARRI